jgi:filamentous hemagglutinin
LRKQWSFWHNAAKGGLPRAGFANFDEFAQFGGSLRSGLGKAGYADAEVILQGSAVTGKSFKTGAAFDVGRVSDFDIALSGNSLFRAAKDAGIGLRSSGTRTGPLNERALRQLGLFDFATQMTSQAGRPVNFMIYKSTEAAVQRTPSIIFPR